MKPQQGSGGLLATATYRFELFPQRRFTHVSDSITAMTGYTPADFYADSDLWRKLIHPDDPGTIEALASGATDPETPVFLRWIGRDGRTVSTEHVLRLHRSLDGVVMAVEGEIHGLTHSMADSGRNAALTEAITRSQEGVVVTDTAGAITYANPAFVQRSGYSLDELLGQNPRILKSGVHSPAFYGRMWRRLASGRSFSGGFVNRRKDGSLMREATIIAPYRDDAGHIAGYVAIKRDTTSEDAAIEALAQERAERNSVQGALAAIEVAADAVVISKYVCDILVATPSIDVAAIIAFDPDGARPLVSRSAAGGTWSVPRRLSAETTTALRRAAQEGRWVEKVDEAMLGRLAHAARDAGVRLTGGVALRTNGGLPGLLLVGTSNDESGAADRLQLALAEYRPIVSHLLVGPLHRRAEMNEQRKRIHDVIRSHAFHPVFQPIVDLARGNVMGYELLTRFADGRPPDQQFAAAHAAGVGSALEFATLTAGVTAARSLPPTTWLSVNVSPELVLDVKKLRGALQHADRPVVLEITEHRAVGDYARLQAALDELPSDISLAVDDVGAGYATFKHILELRPSHVKIDAAIIHGIAADTARQALVAGLRYFADRAGCELIAEGVETEAERKTLQLLGIVLGQGYLLGRPVPHAAPSAWPANEEPDAA